MNTMNGAGVGQRITRRRLELGLSQRDIAFERCSNGYISRIEQGARVPSLRALRELARRLRVPVEWLETGDRNRVILHQLTLAELTESLRQAGVEPDELSFEDMDELGALLAGLDWRPLVSSALEELVARKERRAQEQASLGELREKLVAEGVRVDGLDDTQLARLVEFVRRDDPADE